MEGPDGLKKVARAFQLPNPEPNDLQPDKNVLYDLISEAAFTQLVFIKPSLVSPVIPAAATSSLLL